MTPDNEFIRPVDPPTRAGVTLKQRLAGGEKLLGPLLRMPNEALVEMTGLVGMDFVVVDTEHGPGDQIPLSQHLTAATAAGIPALVRVGSLGEILRVLDLGAAGVIVPHVCTVEQAEAAVRAASYPPRGDRGFATYSRAGRQGLIGSAEHLRFAADNTVVVLMIEDAQGVAAAEQIARVPGVDALFVGPADLAVSLGLPGQQSGAHVQQVISQVHDAARRAGPAVVSITADPASARQHFASGSTAVIYNALAALGALFTELATGREPAPASAARTAAGTEAIAPASTPAVTGSSAMITAGSGVAGSAGDRPAGAGYPIGAQFASSAPAPLVLLPGMFSTARMWEAVIAELDPGIRAVGLRIDRDDTVADMAESVLAQAPQRFSLAGHSLGGTVALEVARRAPHRLQSLVLLECSGRGPSDAQLTAWADLSDRTSDGDFEAVVAEQALINLGPAAADAALVDSWIADARLVGPDGLLRELAAQRTRPDSIPTLPAIRTPTLVVSGEQDEVSPAVLQRELAERIPCADLVTVPGAGHMGPVDSAAAVARLLSAFLARFG